MSGNAKRGYITNKKKKINIPTIIIIIVTLICISINIVLIINFVLKPKAKQEQEFTESYEKNKGNVNASNTITSEEYQLSKLKQGTERDRIEYYCGQFFKYIENKKYEKAYEILYPEFKENYFPTLEKFKEYAEKTYPNVIAINYDDFDRQGDIYITTVIIDDAFATDSNTKFEQRIIVQESDYNKYVLSFQVVE